jgi:hypothetical protein
MLKKARPPSEYLGRRLGTTADDTEPCILPAERWRTGRAEALDESALFGSSLIRCMRPSRVVAVRVGWGHA